MPLLAEWLRCAPYIEAALEYCDGAYELEDVHALVVNGDAQFWPFADAAIVTEIIKYPRKTALRFWLAGGNLQTLADAEPAIVEWAKQYNCTTVEIIGRRGWTRALTGYAPASTIMVKEASYE